LLAAIGNPRPRDLVDNATINCPCDRPCHSPHGHRGPCEQTLTLP
jgi:hypothetical protein